jgi:adenylate cyclase
MEAPHLERKLVAILAADIEGFSRHMEHDEVATLAVLSSHRTVIDTAIAEYRGRITGTAGDSVLAEFASVLSAVNCAVQIQQLLAEENEKLDPERRLMLRIGINVGDVMVKDGDIFGDGVNIAARLEALAEPGGICVSRGVRDHLRKHRIVVFDDLGEQKVKNIAHPVRAFKVRSGAEPPEQELEAAEPGASPEGDGDQSLPGDNVELQLALWDAIKDSEEASEFEVYLERYPDGPFAALATSRHAALIAAQSQTQSHAPKTDGEELSVELAFWEAAKDSSNPAELAAYLERYPEGEFAALAEPRLEALREAEDEKAEPRPKEVEVELAFWESVKDAKNPSMLEAYLTKYPQGSFVSLARIMLEGGLDHENPIASTREAG